MRSDIEAPSEATPLKRNQLPIVTSTNTQNNNTIAISGQTSETVLIPSKMDDTKRILIKMSIDLIILCCVGFPILFFFLWGDPYKRGFFCDDESLMHPFHDSTVRNWMLYIIGIILPVAIITATEFLRVHFKGTEKRSLKIYNLEIPNWVVMAYRHVGVFGFGAACSQLATDIGKYSIGRLRPHFFSVCQPMMAGNTTCSDPINQGKYIEDFTCMGKGSSARVLKEMRLSFPSGHSSFSAYTMIFCAIYLHSQMNWRGSKLTKHFLQFLFIMMTWYTCLTRISDYKHHWSDVLAGATLGSITALTVANFCSDLFESRYKNKILPQTRYELSAPNHVTTNGNNQ